MTRAVPPMLLVLALWGAGLGSAAQFAKLGVIFDHLALAYPGQGEVALGLAVSIVGSVGLVFGTTAGLLVQRLGYRRVLVAALATGAGLSCAQALLPPLPVLLGLRLIEGSSHLAIVVAAPVLIAQIAPGRLQGLAMTLWSSFFAVSFALTAALGRPLVDAQGIAALFLAHGAYMASFALLLWHLLPQDVQVPGLPLSPGRLLRQHAEIYASPRIAAPAMGFYFYALIYIALLTLLPTLAGPYRELLAAAMPLTSIAVSLTLGVWLLGRSPAVRIVQLGFGLTLVTAGLIWLEQDTPLLLAVASLILAAALGLVQGASFAAIPQLNPDLESRSRASGALAQLGNLGTTCCTPLLAALIAGQGVDGLVLFCLLPATAGIALHQWLSARRRALR